MLQINYIPFVHYTGLEIRDRDGNHIINLLPSKYAHNNGERNSSYCIEPMDFTLDELLEAVHRLRKDMKKP